MTAYTHLSGWIALLTFIPVVSGEIDKITLNGMKVQHILKTIEASQKDVHQKTIRKALITQGELNDYIAFRLGREKKTVIKNLQIILLDKNRIRGNIHFELGSIDLLKLLTTDLRFDFDGRLQTHNGAGKLDLTSLYLNGEAVSPRALDPVLAAVALYYGTEPGSADDWYELPKGIERIEINKAEAVLYY